jgi:hypothetical protein
MANEQNPSQGGEQTSRAIQIKAAAVASKARIQISKQDSRHRSRGRAASRIKVARDDQNRDKRG